MDAVLWFGSLKNAHSAKRDNAKNFEFKNDNETTNPDSYPSEPAPGKVTYDSKFHLRGIQTLPIDLGA
jgi:hypothetical protein